MIAVLGAGVAGLCTAVRLAEAGVPVTLYERQERLGQGAASWLAGGMLAPFCEAETADDCIVRPGLAGIDWWAAHTSTLKRNGTLVVDPTPGLVELKRLSRNTSNHQTLERPELSDLEPDLAGRFSQALFFPEEAHLQPRAALGELLARFVQLGGRTAFGQDVITPASLSAEAVIDCRGVEAEAPGLRCVRGEMLIVRCRDITLQRPIRLLHPRWPLYVVPHGEDRFMVGATMVESANCGPVTLRSAVELMNAAYSLHPAFAEAEVLELGAGIRPAFADNLPRIIRNGRTISLTGMYRHGFLLAPDCSEQAAAYALAEREVV
ncbi:FAD-dependent oxidoreductase [Aureimonas fodinaquatilis]|uniref:FAD-dependent oxidoreductase n=1 Tax=Aureimonas fodinaquatilis TaxID=2565783 RepID=A0A5B0E147_9HYPH|nr:FAD-dependent oxidoreductase [Aureimonas fodinaquatilis]KAA0972553.1 FAD-dependent oxidoreductase [Aureimonas fodinaquatilis]